MDKDNIAWIYSIIHKDMQVNILTKHMYCSSLFIIIVSFYKELISKVNLSIYFFLSVLIFSLFKSVISDF